ncbi:MAG: ABC transporter permease, partial [Flavobacteriaceae bacterium]|nr:ABC transporter permease [Flavobacteriaceae bacterium]
KEYLLAGKLLNITEETTNDVLISNTTAKRLGFKVGDTFNTFFMKEENMNSAPNARVFKVAGIFDTGFEEFDETYVIGDIKQVQRLNKWEPDQVGGFEVLLDNFDQLEQKGREIYSNTPSTLNAQTIAVKYQPVFEWLNLLDVNVIVIIAIMVLVAGINMITALLVLILERTQMIGILKSLGSTNLSIRKIFLYNAGYLIFIGLLWGNLLGIIILLIQHYTGIVKFPNPENYYLKTIPVYLHWGYIVLLNIGTLILCLLMLLAPSYIVSRISPVKAIKFD